MIGDDYLDGKVEAEYFDKGLFEKIYNSVDLKVRGFADVGVLMIKTIHQIGLIQNGCLMLINLIL